MTQFPKVQRCGKQKRMCASMCGSERVCVCVCVSGWVCARVCECVCALCACVGAWACERTCVCARALARAWLSPNADAARQEPRPEDGGELGGHARGVAEIEACGRAPGVGRIVIGTPRKICP